MAGRKMIAFPQSRLAQIAAANPALAQIFQEDLVVSEDLLREIIDIRQRTDYILYHGYVPQSGDVSKSFFEDLGTTTTDYWTNIKVGGRTPYAGTSKVIGLGMWVEPFYTLHISELPTILTGWFNFHVGSGETSTLKGPLSLLYTQRNTMCCVASSSPNDDALEHVLSNSPFSGKFGFLPLPNAPRIRDNVNFKLEVTWNSSWTAESNLTLFMAIFVKREIPFAE